MVRVKISKWVKKVGNVYLIIFNVCFARIFGSIVPYFYISLQVSFTSIVGVNFELFITSILICSFISKLTDSCNYAKSIIHFATF